MLVLVTGLYRRVLQVFFVSKLHEEKKEREEEDNKTQLTVDQLKLITEEQEKEIERLQDELRALRILVEDGEDSGAAILVWHCGVACIGLQICFLFYVCVCMIVSSNSTLPDE